MDLTRGLGLKLNLLHPRNLGKLRSRIRNVGLVVEMLCIVGCLLRIMLEVIYSSILKISSLIPYLYSNFFLV